MAAACLDHGIDATPYDYWIDDGIWFWEDVDEPVYRIDRMLTHLRLSGRMQRVRGVVIGALKDCGNGAEMQVFLRDFFAPLGIPVVGNFPVGHHGDNLLMPIGRTVRLSTFDRTFTVTESAVHPMSEEVARGIKAVFKTTGGTGKDPVKDLQLAYAAGDRIFSQGELGTEMFIIQDGAVEILKHIGSETHVLSRWRKATFSARWRSSKRSRARPTPSR